MPANTRKTNSFCLRKRPVGRDQLPVARRAAGRCAAEHGRARAAGQPLGAGSRRTGAAARGGRSDHRLPGRGRPTRDRLPDRRHRPREAERAPAPQDPRRCPRRSPRSSSAIASRARTASRSSCTSARSTTSRRSSTSSCPTVARRRRSCSRRRSRGARYRSARPGRSRAPASPRSPPRWRPPAGTGARRRSPCCPRRPRPRPA